MPTLMHASTETEFISQGCNFVTEKILDACAQEGRCILGLSGGSTPKPIYEALGKNTDIDWTKVWIFLVDDRYINADDPKSNQFLLRSTLLKNAPIPESHLIFPDTSLPLDECIKLYDQHVADLLKKNPADLITLGMGDDGHIASLFPPLSSNASGPSTIIHTTTEKFDVFDRISVTLPVLKNAHECVFFLKGEAKKKVWEDMTRSSEDENRWPAKSILERATVMFG
jgi:6-phosphogluconolactonase